MAASKANIAWHLPAMAGNQPDTLALCLPEGRDPRGEIVYRRLTFRQLDQVVDAWAFHLQEKGFRRGMRVSVLVRPGLDLIAVSFALFKMGCPPVLIDPGMGVRPFMRCVARSAPEGLIAIPRGGLLSRVFFPFFRSVRVRATAGGAPLPPAEEPFPLAPTEREDLAAVLFTSGSTGPAKGVCYQHGMFAAQVELIRDRYGIEPGEVDLPMLPIFALFNPALGMTTVVPEINPSRPAAVDPGRIVQAIRQCEVTNSFGSPVLWKKIARHCRERGLRLPGLRRILMAGASVPPELLADFSEILQGGRVHTPYGATEALPVTSLSSKEILEETRSRTEEGRGSCVGYPFPGMEVRIIRTTDGPLADWAEAEPLPGGEVGEIVVRGPVVTCAYEGLPEATAAALIPDGETFWRRMGDLGYLDGRGRLWFCGRKAERVETEAGVLYTDCCEAVFNRHPKVFRTALIGLGERPNQVPAIVVEPLPGIFPRRSTERTQWVEELRRLGANHSFTEGIGRFFFRRRFPVDVRHNAKIHRLSLARQYNRSSYRY